MDWWFTSALSKAAVSLRLTRRGGVEVQERMVASIYFVAAPLKTEDPKVHEKKNKRGGSKP